MPPKPRLTHFLCLPLISEASRPLLESSVAQFRADLSKRPDIINGNGSVLRSAVRPVGVLHLTLGVMSLPSSERIDAAVSKLQSLDLKKLLLAAEENTQTPHSNASNGTSSSKSTVSASATIIENIQAKKKADPRPMVISLESISSMHDPQDTSIIFISPTDPTDRLYRFCSSIKDAFQDTDLLVPDSRPLKLHVTILNTIYASESRQKNESGRGGSSAAASHRTRGKAPLKVDARQMLESWSKRAWADGDIRLEKVAICKMGAEKTLDMHGDVVNERYREIASKALPA